MTKIYVLIACAVLMSNTVIKAQSYCVTGSQWYVMYNSGFISTPDTSKELYYYAGDSTIFGRKWKKINFFISKYNPGSASTTTSSGYYRLVRDSNSVVYAFRASGNVLYYDTIANFNAHIGDSWLSHDGCGYRKVIVQDTGHYSIQSVTLRTMTVSIPDPNFPNQTNKLMERISCNLFTYDNERLFPDYSCRFPHTDGPMRLSYCYQDYQFNFKYGFNSFCAKTTGINEYTNIASFEITPNPASEQVTIRSSADISRIQIFDMSGRRVLSQEINSSANEFTVDITGISTGVYLCTAITSTGAAFRHKLIKN